MSNSNDSVALSVFKLLMILVISVLTSFYWGWAYMTLWGWFAVIAAGLPSLPYAAWVGASFLMGQITICFYSFDFNKEEGKHLKSEPFAKFVLMATLKILASLFGLLLAYVAFLILI